MLYKISLLSFLIFGAVYPLSFWISHANPLKNKFHYFHLGISCVITSLVGNHILMGSFPTEIKSVALLWMVSLFIICFYYWYKDYPNPIVISCSSIIGLYLFVKVQSYLVNPHWTASVIGILAGCILCSSLFAMNLGHWYLNVHGLPIAHLIRASFIFGVFLGLRAVWDLVMIFSSQILYRGEMVGLNQFILTSDGFLLLIPILFGTVLPLVSLFFVHGTLKLKNTQATTGILYVILCGVVLGDLAYKYYLIKFGIAL